MPDEPRVLHLDVALDGADDQIHGTAHLSAEEDRQFRGWLELVALLAEIRSARATQAGEKNSCE